MTYKVPVSVKGICFENKQVWLRKNEREEWELPGGKLDQGEQPEETVVREMEEELGLAVIPKTLLTADLYKIKTSSDEIKGVLVLAYLCEVIKRVSEFEWECEAGVADFKLFGRDKIDDLNMPAFYKETIKQGFTKTFLSRFEIVGRKCRFGCGGCARRGWVVVA